MFSPTLDSGGWLTFASQQPKSGYTPATSFLAYWFQGSSHTYTTQTLRVWYSIPSLPRNLDTTMFYEHIMTLVYCVAIYSDMDCTNNNELFTVTVIVRRDELWVCSPLTNKVSRECQCMCTVVFSLHASRAELKAFRQGEHTLWLPAALFPSSRTHDALRPRPALSAALLRTVYARRSIVNIFWDSSCLSPSTPLGLLTKRLLSSDSCIVEPLPRPWNDFAPQVLQPDLYQPETP